HSFVYSALPGKVLFGFGTIDKVADEIRQLGCRRSLVLSTPQQAPWAEDLAARLGDLSVGAFTEAAMHTPVAVTGRALDVVSERQADCTVALGGGSTTGLGKAIALSASNRRADHLRGIRGDTDPWRNRSRRQDNAAHPQGPSRSHRL